MAQHHRNRPIDDAAELLKIIGFDELAAAVTVLLNSAMNSVTESRTALGLPQKMEPSGPGIPPLKSHLGNSHPGSGGVRPPIRG